MLQQSKSTAPARYSLGRAAPTRNTSSVIAHGSAGGGLTCPHCSSDPRRRRCNSFRSWVRVTDSLRFIVAATSLVVPPPKNSWRVSEEIGLSRGLRPRSRTSPVRRARNRLIVSSPPHTCAGSSQLPSRHDRRNGHSWHRSEARKLSSRSCAVTGPSLSCSIHQSGSTSASVQRRVNLSSYSFTGATMTHATLAHKASCIVKSGYLSQRGSNAVERGRSSLEITKRGGALSRRPVSRGLRRTEESRASPLGLRSPN